MHTSSSSSFLHCLALTWQTLNPFSFIHRVGNLQNIDDKRPPSVVSQLGPFKVGLNHDSQRRPSSLEETKRKSFGLDFFSISPLSSCQAFFALLSHCYPSSRTLGSRCIDRSSAAAAVIIEFSPIFFAWVVLNTYESSCLLLCTVFVSMKVKISFWKSSGIDSNYRACTWIYSWQQEMHLIFKPNFFPLASLSKAKVGNCRLCQITHHQIWKIQTLKVTDPNFIFQTLESWRLHLITWPQLSWDQSTRALKIN